MSLISVRDRLPAFARAGIAAERFPLYRSAKSPSHLHDMVEMCLVLGGEGEHLLDEISHPLIVGGLEIVHYGVAHRYIDHGAPLDLMNIYLDPAQFPPPPLPADIAGTIAQILPLHPQLMHERNQIRQIPFGEDAGIRQILLLLAAETSKGESACLEALRACYTLLLVAMVRQVRTNLPSRPKTRKAKKSIEDIRLRFDQEPERTWSLPVLAHSASLTPSSLCRAFRRHTGHTISAYLGQRRIEKALMALANTEANITQVALDCGFGDMTHFHRSFRRLVGTSPRAWRTRGK